MKGVTHARKGVTHARAPRTVRALVTLTVAAASLLIAPTAPTASAAEHPDCAIWADTPVLDAGIVTGTGHRDGCVQTRTVTVRLREDRSGWPDRTLGQAQVRSGVINISLTAGGKAHSPRRGINCNEF